MTFPTYRKQLREAIGVKKIDERLFLVRKDGYRLYETVVPKLHNNKPHLVKFDNYYFSIPDTAFRINEYLTTRIIDSNIYLKHPLKNDILYKMDILKDGWKEELDMWAKPRTWEQFIVSYEYAKKSGLQILEV